ncbi:unannotated protein [freshwater metagenome]|uniref:Unannotated protein n=1 Tax=freshwater metagenome TaxID=449393 RepID=A0A6J7RC33_9ZZZZ
MARPSSALQNQADRPSVKYFTRGQCRNVVGSINIYGIGGVDDIDALGCAHLEIIFKGARIFCKIFACTKLRWINKYGDDHGAI